MTAYTEPMIREGAEQSPASGSGSDPLFRSGPTSPGSKFWHKRRGVIIYFDKRHSNKAVSLKYSKMASRIMCKFYPINKNKIMT